MKKTFLSLLFVLIVVGMSSVVTTAQYRGYGRSAQRGDSRRYDTENYRNQGMTMCRDRYGRYFRCFPVDYGNIGYRGYGRNDTWDEDYRRDRNSCQGNSGRRRQNRRWNY